MKAKKNLDLIRINHKIKSALISRFDYLGLLNKEICEDAKEKGFVIQESALSRYLTNRHMVVGSLTQTQILWLCIRYCVGVKIEVSMGKYEEAKAKESLEKFFG